MKNKNLCWLFALLGLLWMLGAIYCYLTEIREYCAQEIFSSDSVANADLKNAFFRDLWFILLSLLPLAILSYLAGRYCRKCKKSNNDDNNWYAELEECKRKYNDLLIKNSGGKVDFGNEAEVGKSASTESVNFTSTATNVETESKSSTSENVDIEALKAKLGIQTTTSAVHSESNSAPKSPTYSEDNLKLFFGNAFKYDDLKIVEGIGPKIAEILNGKGINTWWQLSQTNPDVIREWLLEVGGASYKIHEPATWPEQAKLAYEGKFESLKQLQDNLKGGRE